MLDEALRVEIFIPARNLSLSEINDLVKREQVASLALARLLDGSITWQDYLELLETCKVDIDEYLSDADQNCQKLLL